MTLSVTYDGPTSTLSIYVDGELADSCNWIHVKPSDMALAADLYIGKAVYSDPHPYLNAELGCFSFYSRALR